MTYVVLKFHYGRRGSVNSIISQTMGRVAVINHAYQKEMPQSGSFWVCRIDREITSANSKGCFVISPIEKIDIKKILKLVPGAYEVEIQGTNVLCKPKVSGRFWIAPFNIKKSYIKKEKANILYQSVIVPLVGYEPPSTP